MRSQTRFLLWYRSLTHPYSENEIFCKLSATNFQRQTKPRDHEDLSMLVIKMLFSLCFLVRDSTLNSFPYIVLANLKLDRCYCEQSQMVFNFSISLNSWSRSQSIDLHLLFCISFLFVHMPCSCLVVEIIILKWIDFHEHGPKINANKNWNLLYWIESTIFIFYFASNGSQKLSPPILDFLFSLRSYKDNT